MVATYISAWCANSQFGIGAQQYSSARTLVDSAFTFAGPACFIPERLTALLLHHSPLLLHLPRRCSRHLIQPRLSHEITHLPPQGLTATGHSPTPLLSTCWRNTILAAWPLSSRVHRAPPPQEIRPLPAPVPCLVCLCKFVCLHGCAYLGMAVSGGCVHACVCVKAHVCLSG